MLNKKRGFELCKGVDPMTKLPKRKTKHSAGYDFYLPEDLIIAPYSKASVSFGVKAYMQDDDYLALHIRSSIGFKYGLRMANGTGIIDSDYYSNPDNDGNIAACFINDSAFSIFLEKGERVVQGIFQKYLLADDDEATEERIGGIGSTGK